MSSTQNSCRLQVLLQHKANLESSLEEKEEDLLKITRELVRYIVISKETYYKYASLDQDHLETDVKVRYILQQVCERVRGDNKVFDMLLRALCRLGGGVKGVCEAMRKELERVEGGKASSGAEVGNEMQLVEGDIPDLVELLVSGSHYWEKIGIALHLRQHKLSDCGEGKDNINRLSKILATWILGDYDGARPATLNSLRKALASETVGLGDVARKLLTYERSLDPLPVTKNPSIDTEIIYQSYDSEVAEDKSTLLEVQVISNGCESYQWSKDGQPLFEGADFSGVSSNMLYINRASQGTEGKYSCCVSNGSETRCSNEMNLMVIYPPEKENLRKMESEVPQDSWPPVGKVKSVYDYQHYLNTRESLELFFLKLIFLGLPRLGKTTARRRLTGVIADLVTAGEAEQPHPSTGTVESGPSMIVSLTDTTAVINESKWAGMENLKEEACMLFRIMDDIIDRKKKVSLSAAPRSSGDPVQTVDESTASQSSVVPHQHGSMPEQESRPVADFPSPVATSQPRNILQLATFFKEAMVSEYWEDVKHMFKDKFKAYLRMEDTGGQPELMDMLPALTVGPGLYLLFLNLEHDLQSRYKVSYCSKEGENSIPVESTYTVEEMFLSALSSIACSNTSTTSGISSEEATNPEMIKILESSKSVAYVVGTHKDKVPEQHIVDFDKLLQTIIRSTDFFKKGTVRFWSENKLVIAMNNMTGGTEEIDEIRKLLGEGMEKHFNKLKIPVVWLLFSLCLRITAEQNKQRTADLNTTCMSLARDFGMSHDETMIALRFLHHHAGVIMYFPDVDELKDLVILDNQIVYDSVTFVILKAMKFKVVGQAAAEKFKETGQFLLDDLTKATAEVSGDHIPPLKLVALLDFLHIIARILPTPASQPSSENSPGEEVAYIMPCVLNSASTEELDRYCKNAASKLSAVPIMVHYKCGFVPMGVFPAFIACIIANEHFKLIQICIKKNKVQFKYGNNRSVVTFMSRPKYYEIHIKRETTAKTPLEEDCVAIRKELETTFEKVSSRMNYGCFMDYQFSFECTDHTICEWKSKHLGVVERKETSPHYMDCLSNRKNPKTVELKNCHRVWYGEQRTSSCLRSLCNTSKIGVALGGLIYFLIALAFFIAGLKKDSKDFLKTAGLMLVTGVTAIMGVYWKKT